MRILLFLFLLFLGYCGYRTINPNPEFYVDLVTVSAVQTALNHQGATFGPILRKRAPDGAWIVAGVVTARRRDLSYQLRIEEICTAPETSCYRPHIVYLGKPI